jgi:hypothetical protein
MKIDRYISAGNFPDFPLFPAVELEMLKPPNNMQSNSRFWGLKAETDERCYVQRVGRARMACQQIRRQYPTNRPSVILDGCTRFMRTYQ